MTTVEGTRTTVIAAVPLFPSIVATIVADPSATAVTSPVPAIVAMEGALVDQVMARPTSVFPLASLAVAVNWCVLRGARLAVYGDTETEATGTGVTVIVAVADLVSLVAVIVALPAATPVTRPVALTLATAAMLDDQVGVRPVRVFPAASSVVAVSCWAPPTVIVAVDGLTVTLDTSTVTVTCAEADAAPDVAVMVAVPFATAATRPDEETVAIA
jgi:hypothetical protein